MSRLITAVATCLVLTGCSDKTTTTQVAADGTQTTTVTEKKPWGTTTNTTTQAPASMPNSNQPGFDPSNPNQPGTNSDQTNVNLQFGKDTADGADKVHVRGPGIKIDASDDDERVDIKVPFVNVHRDGNGQIKVKTPFVNIDANENR